MESVIITGACGFIGHHVVDYMLQNTNFNIVIIDKLSYASNGTTRLEDIKALNNPRITLYTWDLEHPISSGLKDKLKTCDYIVHMAAETHVNNSILDAKRCIMINTKSTVEILELAKELPKLKKFIYFGTDEVFGSAPKGISFTETDVHNPSNPYSASKSASEAICISYANTFKIPVMIMHVMNVFGERQHIEKYIPKVVSAIMNGESLKIHCYQDSKTPGSRFYIYAKKVAEVVHFLLKNGKIGETYNVRGQREVNNEDLYNFIAKELDRPALYTKTAFDADRPGHDLRYDICDDKLRKLGYCIDDSDFDQLLKQVIHFTANEI